MDLLTEINEISKIHPLDRDDIDTIMLDFAKRITKTLHIERMSVWLLDENKTKLTSAAEYDTKNDCLVHNNELLSKDFPAYFKAIRENKIILASDIKTNEQTIELKDKYSVPNDIISLMDIPLRIEGELIGVMCFEKTGSVIRQFDEKEQVFALSIGIVFASNLEARHRRKLQFALEKELNEKAILVKEIHHRVKNNFAVVSGLIGLQVQKAKDTFHEELLNELRTKIISIAGIHEIVYNNKSYSEVDAQTYILKLTQQIHEFYQTDQNNIQLSVQVEEIDIAVETMIPIALIINEVLTNCFKHAFKDKKTGEIKLTMSQKADSINLIIQDDGPGFSHNKITNSMLGLEIVKSLVEQINGTFKYEGENGVTFSMTITVER